MGDLDVLTEPYFAAVGGFPPKQSLIRVEDWDGSGQISVWCTQLPAAEYSNQEKLILSEWLRFLTEKPDSLTALHFNSKVSQELFNAACAQRCLQELRFKWGSYKDLSELRRLTGLRYLYIGSGAGVTDCEPLAALERLEVLSLENFRKITDYGCLAGLKNLKQLCIEGSLWTAAAVESLDFLRELPALRSVIFRNVRVLNRPKTGRDDWAREFPSVRFLE